MGDSTDPKTLPTADQEQLENLNRIRGMTGSKDTGVPERTFRDWLEDLFVDKRDPYGKKTDWMKVGFLGGAGTIGGMIGMAFGHGSILGLAAGSLAGAGVMALGANWLADWIRGNPTLPPPIFSETPEPDPNKKVMGLEKLKMPEVKPLGIAAQELTLPHYNPGENPDLYGKRVSEVASALTVMRKVAADGDPRKENPNGVINKRLREAIALMERDLKQKRANLEWLADSMRETLPEPAGKVAGNLKALGLKDDKAAPLSLQFALPDGFSLQKAPGLSGSFSEAGYADLDSYGKQILSYYLVAGKHDIAGKTSHQLSAEAYEGVIAHPEAIAGQMSEDERKAVETLWNNYSLDSKATLIRGFASRARWESLRQNADYRDLFPMQVVLPQWMGGAVVETPPGMQGVNPVQDLNPHSLFNQVREADNLARRTHDWGPVADKLKERLRISLDGTAPYQDPERLQKLETLILAYEADAKGKRLDSYMGFIPEHKDLDPKSPYMQRHIAIDRFERDWLPAYGKRIDTLHERYDGLEKTGLFLVSESPVTDKVQSFELQDVRTATPATVRMQVFYSDYKGEHIEKVIFDNGSGAVEIPAEKLKTKDMPAGAAEKIEALKQITLEAESRDAGAHTNALPDFGKLIGPFNADRPLTLTFSSPHQAELQTTLPKKSAPPELSTGKSSVEL